MIRVGTSGWQYDDWRGVLYPEGLAKARWLSRYAEAFSTVEVNNSFYRLPSAATFARWREETPEGFVVAVKASRFITHLRRLRDCRDPVALLWERASELGPRLGPVLFQLPPRFRADPERLARFVPVTAGLGIRKAWAATIDYTPDHLPIIGPVLREDGRVLEGCFVASAGGHGMMWGPAVARAAADLATRGRTDVVDVSNLGMDRFDALGRSPFADRVALPFPADLG